MLLKRTPILVIFFLTIIRIGVFYAQEIPLQYICPRGYLDHRGFICQCSKPTTKIDTVFTTKIRKYKYCPQGIHDSYCQCGPNRYSSDKESIVIKKKWIIRFRK